MTHANEVGEPVIVDLLIRHGYIITMDAANTIFSDGAVAISEGRILCVGDDKIISAEYFSDNVVDAHGGPVHPGFIECHVHTSLQFCRGALPDYVDEHDVFDSLEARFYNTVNDEEEYLSVLLAGMEMISNGTTCFVDPGTVLNPEMAARAATSIGIRAILGDPFIWDSPQDIAMGELKGSSDGCKSCERQGSARTELVRAPKNLSEALDRLGGELWRNSDPNTLVHGHIAVLGLGTASEELMMEAKGRADAAGVVVNFHQSYSPSDTAHDRQRFGEDPLVHLSKIGFLDRNSLLAHANFLTDVECDSLLESGASIAWAPAASMMWGHGGTMYGRHAELLGRGANIGLGSDSSNWSNSLDIWRQANLAITTARDVARDRNRLVAEHGFEMATRNAAAAVGHGDKIGILESGKCADIVIHTLDRPEIVPCTNMIRNLMYSAGSKSVHTVIVAGDIVLAEGKFTKVDGKQVLGEMRHVAASLMNRIGYEIKPNFAQRQLR